jgi:hypothetical protein
VELICGKTRLAKYSRYQVKASFGRGKQWEWVGSQLLPPRFRPPGNGVERGVVRGCYEMRSLSDRWTLVLDQNFWGGFGNRWRKGNRNQKVVARLRNPVRWCFEFARFEAQECGMIIEKGGGDRGNGE